MPCFFSVINTFATIVRVIIKARKTYSTPNHCPIKLYLKLPAKWAGKRWSKQIFLFYEIAMNRIFKTVFSEKTLNNATQTGGAKFVALK